MESVVLCYGDWDMSCWVSFYEFRKTEKRCTRGKGMGTKV